MMFNKMDIRINYSAKIRLATIFLSSVALPILPAFADASLEELQARLERAQKENITLKTEKLERENLTMKAEKLEEENAKLRSEANSKPVAPVASNSPATRQVDPASAEIQHKKISADLNPKESYPDADKVKKVQALSHNEDDNPHVGQRHASRVLNEAIDSIPKDDPRREITALVQNNNVSPIIKQWDGIYAGAYAGYGANDVNTYSSTTGFAAGTLNYNVNSPEPIAGGSASAQYFAGPEVGGTIGYNHEFSNRLILGAETDLAWADINNNHITGTNNWAYTVTPSVRNITSVNNRTGLDWIGTTRVRLGYSLGNFLPYLTGGLAYGGLTNSAVGGNIFGYGSFGYDYKFGNSSGSNYSSVKAGWALGAGAEYMVANNWSVKGEYLYTQLAGLNGATNGTSMSTFNCGFCTPTSSAASGPVYTQTTMGAFGIHQVRVGLNYHTGWLGSTQAVTAKY